MASLFKKDDYLRLKAVTPTGHVQKVRMDDDGNVEYLLKYRDAADVEQERWFREEELERAQ